MINPQHVVDMHRVRLVQEQSTNSVASQMAPDNTAEDQIKDECSDGVCQISWKPVRAGIPISQ